MSLTLMRALILTISIVASAPLTFGQQTTIAPAKKTLIAEMITVINADRQVENTVRVMFDEMDRGYPAMIEQLIEKRYSSIPVDQKKEILEILLKRNTGEQSFRNRMMASIDFHDFVEKTFYPLYDKFFTESELADLVTFYKSPTGKKLMEVTPQLFAESIRLSQEILVPKLVEISDKTIDGDIAKVRESLPKKPVKN